MLLQTAGHAPTGSTWQEAVALTSSQESFVSVSVISSRKLCCCYKGKKK